MKNKYEIMGISQLLDQGWEFQHLTYLTFGEGKYIAAVKYPDNDLWVPMAGRNRFKSALEAQEAIGRRILLDVKIKKYKEKDKTVSQKLSFAVHFGLTAGFIVGMLVAIGIMIART